MWNRGFVYKSRQKIVELQRFLTVERCDLRIFFLLLLFEKKKLEFGEILCNSLASKNV